jgi:CO dehydrogenase/acetyl-CoA synthase beta subunit
MNDMPNRRDRRSALKFQKILRKKSKLPYNIWCKITTQSVENGNQIFNAKKDAVEKLITEQLEAKELSLIEFWKDSGYNEEAIEKLREVYALSTIKYESTKKEDKKTVKRLLKEVEELKIK